MTKRTDKPAAPPERKGRFATLSGLPLETLYTAADLADREADSSIGYRSEEHTSELQSLSRISYAVFCLTTMGLLVSIPSWAHTPGPKITTVAAAATSRAARMLFRLIE